MRSNAGSLLLVLIMSTSQLSRAQLAATPEVGANPYKSYSGGQLDHIQMQNGSLYLRIPLLSYPQLGKLHLGFSILANGSQFSEIGYCDPIGNCNYAYGNPLGLSCASAPSYTGGPGSATIVVDEDITLDGCFNLTTESYISSGGMPESWTDLWGLYELTDSSGAKHSLGYDQSDWTRLQSTDGSGYSTQFPYNNTLNAAALNAGSQQYPFTIYDSSGLRYAKRHDSSVESTSISDPLGNIITRLSGTANTNIIDSIGRIIPDPSHALLDANPSACPNIGVAGQLAQVSKSWTVPGYQGSLQTFHFCYTYVHVLTDFFGVPGGQQADCSIVNLPDDEAAYICSRYSDIDANYLQLQSVVLPDGRYWGFGYDSSSSPTQISYGDLTRVILPTGGYIDYTYTMIPVCGSVPGYEAGQPLGRAVTSRTLQPIVGSPVKTTFSYRAGAWGGKSLDYRNGWLGE